MNIRYLNYFFSLWILGFAEIRQAMKKSAVAWGNIHATVLDI